MNSAESGVNQVFWVALTVGHVADVLILTARHAAIVHLHLAVGRIGVAVAFEVSRSNAKAAAGRVSDASGTDDLTPVA